MLTSLLLFLCSPLYQLHKYSIGSTHFANLKKLHNKQKHAMLIINNNAKFEHKRYLFRKNKILNRSQLNILNNDNVMFMHRIPTKTACSAFHPCFSRSIHSYPTGHVH